MFSKLFLSSALSLSVLAVPSTALFAQSAPLQLTVDAIYAHGSLTGSSPGQLTWSPDAKHLTYHGKDGLVELDQATGKEHILIPHDKLAALAASSGTASEKDADHRSRYSMAGYLWTPDSTRVLFDINGKLWLSNPTDGKSEQVGTSGEGSGDDPKFSPNGEYLSFIRNHGLATIHLGAHPSEPKSLTTGASPTLLNGEVDWVYEEELDVRSNYFWSPDSKHLAYLQMDEAAVPEYPLVDWIPTHADIDKQRYPQPGDPNPSVKIGIVGAEGGTTTWVSLPIKSGTDYIPRFGWVNANTLWVETLTRDHKHLDIYFANAKTGEGHLVLSQHDDKFFNEGYDLRVFSNHVLIPSWQDGHTHLYLYSFNAATPLSGELKLEKQLTQGNFEVRALLGVDEAQKLVYFASNEGDPREQQLWQVDFNGNRKALTTTSGFHDGNFAPTGGAFVDKFSTRMKPTTISLCPSSASCSVFSTPRSLDAYHLKAPVDVTVPAHDGTTLYATLLLPESTGSATVPLIVNPYGGPAAQNIQNHWGGDGFLFDQVLISHGFAVLHTDNRGMGARGRDFAQAAYHNFGPIQLEDQLTVLDAVLAKYPQLDGKRLGWWGWSWGGTFTLYALSHSDRFTAGVSVAPVTEWHNYDSIYTERYLNEPKDFPEDYQKFSAVTSAANLKGHLLMIHGTGDDNVHISNSVQYIQQLTVHNIPYSLNIYPRKTHSIAGTEVRPHLFESILNHFEQYLQPSK